MRNLLLIFLFCSFSLYGVATISYGAENNQIADDEAEVIKHFDKDISVKAPAEVESEKVTYRENNPLEDFEVHFFISLPFTALYSYVAVSSLDAIVQGKYPASFRTTNTWMIIGLAVGSSVAIALGSVGRVPDQSVQEVTSQLDWNEAVECTEPVMTANKMEILKIVY